MIALKLKRNESFSIRDGWIDKAINSLISEENIFYKNNGIRILGIGANMVKSLKYWLFASQIIEGKDNALSNFGKLIFKFDRYLEDNFTWYLIHYFLCSNFETNPVFYSFFNDIKVSNFTKKELIELLNNDYLSKSYAFNEKSLEDDISVLLKSYTFTNSSDNPEDNYNCPLSNLRLLSESHGKFSKEKSRLSSLHYLVVYYALTNMYEDKFDISDSMIEQSSPYKIFNLDKNSYFQLIEEMKNDELIILNKTAGLNIVYFKQRLSLEEIFNKYFGGGM